MYISWCISCTEDCVCACGDVKFALEGMLPCRRDYMFFLFALKRACMNRAAYGGPACDTAADLLL